MGGGVGSSTLLLASASSSPSSHVKGSVKRFPSMPLKRVNSRKQKKYSSMPAIHVNSGGAGVEKVIKRNAKNSPPKLTLPKLKSPPNDNCSDS